MCTLAIAFQVFEGTPIAVAANRDELLERPSTGPAKRAGSPAIIAPRDEEAGGTWIGVNEHGVFVAITNRWTDGSLAGERSRGLLVLDALEQPAADDAIELVESALAADEYEGFNLVVADAERAVVLEWDGELRISPLDPGLHVVMNTGFDDRFEIPDDHQDIADQQIGGARRVMTAMAPEPGETAADWLDRAPAVLGDHEVGVCIHRDGYGTRSASLLAIGADSDVVYRFADGPPCETGFEPVNEQF